MHVRWLVSACSIGASGPTSTTTTSTASASSIAASAAASTATAATITLTVGPSTDERRAGRGKHWRRWDRSNLGHRYRWFRQLRQHYVIG
uniref:Putative secreted peptide n=1 Tax=Anopheles braziliensis TaxID=58242 RepID=A0A2M3ZRW0_9DIPT